MKNETPEIQNYGTLAADYDAKRYEGGTNLLKEQFRRSAIADLLPDAPATALDVACGTGRGVALLSSIAQRAYGVDGTAEMLRVALGKLSGQSGFGGVCRGNAAQLPFSEGTFDAVTCLNFVHLFPAHADKQAFVREMGRVLKRGGVAVIEFDNAMTGVALGIFRKYFGADIGYDWPWIIRASFPKDVFEIEVVRGTNFPGIWRIPALRRLESIGRAPLLKHFASRTLVRARRK
jgi:ubiquinone/menaquinone biosynthesis C-methylase UbiE